MMGRLIPIECETKVIEDQGGLLIAKESDFFRFKDWKKDWISKNCEAVINVSEWRT